jgi:hypothetical protein
VNHDNLDPGRANHTTAIEAIHEATVNGMSQSYRKSEVYVQAQSEQRYAHLNERCGLTALHYVHASQVNKVIEIVNQPLTRHDLPLLSPLVEFSLTK